MPFDLPSFCREPGCGALVKKGYCAKHKLPPRTREKTAARGYGSQWQQLSRAFLAAHPMCCVTGCTRRSTEVDHIVPIREDYFRRFDVTNLRAMCKQHHSARTARDQNRRRHGKETKTDRRG